MLQEQTVFFWRRPRKNSTDYPNTLQLFESPLRLFPCNVLRYMFSYDFICNKVDIMLSCFVLTYRMRSVMTSAKRSKKNCQEIATESPCVIWNRRVNRRKISTKIASVNGPLGFGLTGKIGVKPWSNGKASGSK